MTAKQQDISPEAKKAFVPEPPVEDENEEN